MIDKAYKYKGYWHFDGRKPPSKHIIKKVEDIEFINKHSFYPLLHNVIEFKKYKHKSENEKENRKAKVRDIYYCAHIDRYIYQYYAKKLNKCYDDYLRIHNFDEVSIAYRIGKGLCNIHFAQAAFSFLKEYEAAFVFIGDFTNFFDSLDHKYLKKMICEVQNKTMLDEAEYKIFKNITKFAYIELKDAADEMGSTLKDINRCKKIMPPMAFRNLKISINKNYHKAPNISFGIPQGSPISAIYANVYMLEFDKRLADLVGLKKGFYRRYSDDFIIIIPHLELAEAKELSDEIFRICSETQNIDLQKDKTNSYFFKDKKIENCNEVITGNTNATNEISFLGFTFNGRSIKLRDKTIGKYYYKLYGAIDRQKAIETKFGSRLGRKKVIRKKSKFGSNPQNNKHGNFITYVKRSEKIFDNETEISKVKNRNLNKISSRFNDNKK